LVLAVLSFVGAGALLPDLEQRTEDAGLRYTDSVVEGAPPWVAVGTAIGALRGLVVDVLWIKVNLMKEEGDYFEVMALSDLITKLQPRFAAVWAYHGHNMALQHFGRHPHAGRAMGLGPGRGSFGTKRRLAAQP